MISSLHSVPKRYISPSEFGGLVLGLVLLPFAPTSLADSPPIPPTEDVEAVSEEPEVAAVDAEAEFRKVADEKTRVYLNDLSARRRVTTLFLNRQSMLHGVQENFVNTSRGNLTFLVRDLVRVGGMPIVFGRVHDSSLQDNGDFGPGWKLTVDERIVAQGSHLFYTDASNVTHKLSTSGDDIIPVVAAWTPIRAGQIRAGGNVIVLESNDLVRLRFKRMGDAYRLVAASHTQGTMQLAYQQGLLTTISSEHGSVKLTRHSDGRIVSAQDDLGRTITYEYDDVGRLAAVIDLGGETWDYQYAGGSGELVSMTDPRGMKVLEASLHGGRVTSVQVLGRETRFTHNGATTEATDVLGRTTTFHQSASGITEGITDPSGSFTQITFDDQYRPIKITRDGGSVTHLGYDELGRLASIDRPDGESTTYAYNRRGLVAASGSETVRYRYSEGRVAYAEDTGGVRTYEYDDNGALSAVSMNGEGVQFSTNAMGFVTKVIKDGQSLMDYAYDDQGRVATIGFGHGERSAMATYKYNRRGFRETADYSYGVKSRMDYDAVGNLIHYAVVSPDGQTVSQDYEIGLHNEVLRIQNSGIDDPDVSFRYDEAGRVYDIQAGDRTANVAYDNLDRAKRVTLDGETLLEYNYENLETDAVAKKDALSGEVWTAVGTSSVFGTMDSIVYSRPRPLEFGPVAYEPALKTLYVETGHLAPDAVLLSSLARRMVPFVDKAVNGAPFGQDKPSNSLFVPPEYRSVNCHVCSRWASGLRINAGSTMEGSSANISVLFQASCRGRHIGVSSTYSNYPNNGFVHRIDYGDGTSSRIHSGRSPVSIKRKYFFKGSYTITDRLSCSCASLMTLATASTTVTVLPSILCSYSNADRVAIRELHGYLLPGAPTSTTYSTEPFERGFTMRCRGLIPTRPYVRDRYSSNPYRNRRTPSSYNEAVRVYTAENVIVSGMNVCQINLGRTENDLFTAHSHPYFDNLEQYNAGYFALYRREAPGHKYDPDLYWNVEHRGGCRGGTGARPDLTIDRIRAHSEEGSQSFSMGDKLAAERDQKPFYLLTPTGRVKVYTNRRNHSGTWDTFVVSEAPSPPSVPYLNPLPPIPNIPSIPPLFPGGLF